MFSMRKISYTGYLILIFMVALFSVNILLQLGKSHNRTLTNIRKTLSTHEVKEFHNKSANFIFIGGFARSGTTLMRAILDVHPNIKCGPETKILPSLVDFISTWKSNHLYLDRDLNYAGVGFQKIDEAIANFVQNILLNRGLETSRVCAKDPDIVKHMEYLHSIFQKTKFIYMVRDGRAASYSLMQQINDQQTTNIYTSYLRSWYTFNLNVTQQCKKLGKEFCLLVKYEDLVLHPENTLKRVVLFLNEAWDEKLLKHSDYVDKIKISKSEWSSHQIIKPIYSDSLTQWVGKIPVKEDKIQYIYPLLKIFNYTYDHSSLNYNEKQADKLVIENSKKISQNRKYWDDKAKNYSDHYLKMKLFNEKLIY